MSHRYLVALVDGGGNIPPELHRVRRLVERGHGVTLLIVRCCGTPLCW